MSKREKTMTRTAGQARSRRRNASPASIALDEINTALRAIPEVGAVIRTDGSETLYIDTIVANPMDEGHGSRAMGIICAICDRLDVTLSGHIVHDEGDRCEDDPFADGEDFEDEEDFDDEAPLSPSSDDLERWYARFGFELARGNWKTAICRPPKAMALDVSPDGDPETPEAPAPGL